MAIFNSDGDKIDQLNKKLCEKAGFPGIYSVSTQTVCILLLFLLPEIGKNLPKLFLASATFTEQRADIISSVYQKSGPVSNSQRNKKCSPKERPLLCLEHKTKKGGY